MVTLFSLYTFKLDSVSDLNLDFYLVCIVFLLELCYEIYIWVVFIKKAKSSAVEVSPDSDEPIRKKNKFNSFDDSANDISIEMPPISKKNESSSLVDHGKQDAFRGSNESPIKKKR